MTSRTITVRLEQQYGQQTVQPACETARLFAQLAGTKTLTKPSIELIKQLGYEIRVEQTLPATL